MNPPYSSDLIGKFRDKLIKHVKNGDIEEAIVLINNNTETKWFCDFAQEASGIVFPTGRINFVRGDGKTGPPLQGQAFIYFGSRVESFFRCFKEFGWMARIYKGFSVEQ